MEIGTALLLGRNPRMLTEIADVLIKESVSVLLHTGSFLETLEKVHSRSADIVVLSVSGLCFEAFNLVRELSRVDRCIRVIVLTMQNLQHFSARYRRAGAAVVLGAAYSTGGLTFILRALRSGYGYFDFIFAPIKSNEKSYSTESDLIATLTDRELVVLQALAFGFSNQEIAEKMNIGSRSVSFYKSSIFEKLQLDSISELGELVVRNKLS
ncbi:response regulator transcription factor [Pseudomonas sp. RC4D1]|uniref:response regulator transcription factor n=1 Tax=Pseudomonas sp. RC4D1 TaxID=2834407 RepID=UPI001BD0354E|nr:response regulator transcription factor [Pseudomonas sp. RC4D1]MBS7560117.1 response regulator transcription factor [Pseudomonas sp. RC4D1]